MTTLLSRHFAILGALGLQFSMAEVFSKAGTYSEGAVPISVPTFVSILTAVVAVISLAIAVFGVLSLWGGYKLREYVSSLRTKFTKEYEDWHEEIGSAHTEILKSQAEIKRYALSIKQSAGAFHPSGNFLSEEIKGILKDLELENCECGEVIEALVEKLSSIFLANAEFGLQIQKLYVGEKDEVLASIMYLSQKPSPSALSSLRERLNFEKKLPESAPDLIEALVKAIAEMKRKLELSSRKTEDLGKQKK